MRVPPRLAALAVCVALLAVGGCTGSDPAPTDGSSPHPNGAAGADPRGMFYASIAADHGAVDAVSTRTGDVIRQVAPAQREGMAVAGVSKAAGPWLLVTYAKGPACTSNIAGCGPRPGTCGAEVVRVNVDDGTTTTLWRVGPDQLLSAAALSPDGSLLAAGAAPCVPSYFNDHLVVRRLATGQTWTIGAGVARCHFLGAPHWTDSGHLVVAYAPPIGKTPYRGPDGTCSQTHAAMLVTIDALHSQAFMSGTVGRPSASCSWQSVAALKDQVYAVEACGHGSTHLDGPAKLVQLNSALRRIRTVPIGRCTDGNSVAAAPGLGVLLSAYLFCNPPPKGQKPGHPVTVLDRLVGGRLHRIATKGGGETAWDELAW